jgi:hypothetical protein
MARTDHLKWSLAEAAEITGLSPQWLLNLARAGYFKAAARGVYRADHLVRGIIKKLREEKPVAAPSVARIKLVETQRRLAEHRLDKEQHRTIDIDESVQSITNWWSTVKFEAYHLTGGLTTACNARYNSEFRELIDSFVRRFLHRLSLRLEAEERAQRTTGKADEHDVSQFHLLGEDAEFPPEDADRWVPPPPSPTVHMGTDHYNSHTYIAWRSKLAILAAPHRSDEQLAAFLTIADPAVAEALGTTVSDLTAVTPEVVARVRAEEAQSIAGIRQAIDADKARRDAWKARHGNGAAAAPSAA